MTRGGRAWFRRNVKVPSGVVIRQRPHINQDPLIPTLATPMAHTFSVDLEAVADVTDDDEWPRRPKPAQAACLNGHSTD